MNGTRATTLTVVSFALLRVRQAPATHDTGHSSRWRQRPIVEHTAACLGTYTRLALMQDTEEDIPLGATRTAVETRRGDTP